MDSCRIDGRGEKITQTRLLLPSPSSFSVASRAEIRENVTRIDEISDRNYRIAVQNPEAPEPSVSEKFTAVRFGREAGQRFGRQR